MTKTLSKLFFEIASISRKIGKNLSQEDRIWNKLLQDWHQLDAKKHLRITYDELEAASVVFDLGGYQGQWASDIFAKYGCEVHVFEPHPVYVQDIRTRFAKNDQIRIYDFGLGAKDEMIELATAGDATSVFKSSGNSVQAKLKEASVFIQEGKFDKVHLMKINIEGGEYDLLDHLIAIGMIKRINNLQIQFHHFVPDAENRMFRIQQELEKTHSLTYQYKFLWENWKIK